MKLHLITFAIVLAATPAMADDMALEDALWERVVRENTPAIMELYLQLFPDGPHAPHVLKRWWELTHLGDPNLLLLPPEGRWRAT